MIEQILAAFGFRKVAKQPVESIPLAEAMLCVGCESVTRQTRHGTCQVCGEEALVNLRKSILNREEEMPCR